MVESVCDIDTPSEGMHRDAEGVIEFPITIAIRSERQGSEALLPLELAGLSRKGRRKR